MGTRIHREAMGGMRAERGGAGGRRPETGRRVERRGARRNSPRLGRHGLQAVAPGSCGRSSLRGGARREPRAGRQGFQAVAPGSSGRSNLRGDAGRELRAGRQGFQAVAPGSSGRSSLRDASRRKPRAGRPGRRVPEAVACGWLLLAAWTALAGCGPGIVLPEVPRDRTMILMNGGPNQYALFDNQNPYIPGSDQGFHMGTLPTIFEPLIMYNVLTGEHENWLAESWEYDDTWTVLTVRLRRGIEWADGRPFTARDVAFTFEMVQDHAESMVHLADLPEFFDFAEVVDDHTVRFHLKKPGPAFWATTLSSNHGIQVLPEHVWRHVDPLEFTFHDIDGGLPLGTGPYRMVYASPYQKIYDLRQDWWAAREGFKRLPRMERIIYVPQQEESQSAQLLLTDQLDMAPIMQVLTLESVLERNPRVVTFSGREPPYGYLDWCPIDLNLNCSEPPYDDPEIRRAISMAIDRDKVVQLAESGAGVVALHPFTPYEWFAPFDEALQEILARHGYDSRPHPEEVVRIMEGKGYGKDEEGFWTDAEGERIEIAMYVPQWLRSYGPPLTQQLRDAGFDANFDTSPGLTSLVQTGEQTASLGCKGPSGVRGMDPYLMLSYYTSQYYRPTGQPAPLWSTISRWRNDEFDRIVERTAPLQVGDPELLELFTEAMEIWVREMPDIFLAQLIIRYPCNTTRWSGWPSSQDPYGFPHSWQWELLKTFIRLEPVGRGA